MDVSFKRLLKLNRPEASVAAVGCLASGLLGIQMPAFAFAMASIISAYYKPVPLSALFSVPLSCFILLSQASAR